MQQDTVATIVACATGHVQAGISIVRISGPDAKKVGAQLSQRQVPKPNQASYRRIYDKQGDEIDRGILIYFQAPASFTGEDLVEIHSHGSPYIVQQIIEACLGPGVELAKPGAFSERAFLNGKIDLVQAEAIADLIASQTKAQAVAANASVQGAFSQEVHKLQDALTQIRTQLEAMIDFSDQAISTEHEQSILSHLQKVADQSDTLIEKVKRSIMTQAGLQVVLLGEPNVGKSSLLNQLTQQDYAIVTDIPGTTRDTLRARVAHQGQSLEIIDTAGLRDSVDPIESIGIQKAIQAVQSADVIWLVVDATKTTEEKVRQQLTHIPREKLPVLLRVGNKCDRIDEQPTPPFLDMMVSAIRGDNMVSLLDLTLEKAGRSEQVVPFSARKRHLLALEAFRESVQHAIDAPAGLAELIAEDLRQAQQSLSEITGEFHSEDLLDAIFRTFCLGK
jgi:tRNA modification GTPase